MPMELKGEVRSGKSHSAVRILRQEGRVPASLYGKKVAPTSISVLEKDLFALLKSNAHGVVQLDVPSVGIYPVVITELQKDKMNGGILHVDFHQISMDEPIRSLVKLELVGTAKGIQEGGILQVELHETEVHCLPKDLPAVLQVDISGLEVGESVHASNIQVPAGVELMADPMDVIATVLAPQKGEDQEDTSEGSTGENEPDTGIKTENA
ncbi:50S ribosomal protein L25 [Gorillibacterium massiliense]|uniref:50S ribosomal protein L25 n=1 Tax=Gorillibacterium massiliense TaxID=1280390 RepID=UPI0004B61986|nr:50S ribosomal protein L25 [Gorillibacterium massiliense]